ncbi:MAG: PEP-CTERM sorting domain-containing protein [Candidatus Zixiibacteriota bacterium]|nr:MAG: PEP-CTERM sorting domain-containing protein [candidate division Zixibacteria bacterium]
MVRTSRLTVLLLLFATSCFGFNYHFDEVFSDGSTPFDHNNNWAPYDYPQGVGHLPSPGMYGAGGEYSDLEGLQVTEVGDFVYVALANSFGHTAYWEGNPSSTAFRLGDLFIGTGSTRYAVELGDFGSLGTTSLWDVTGGAWTSIEDIPHSYYNSTAIRTAAGAHKIDQGLASLVLGGNNVEFALSMESDYETYLPMGGNGDTWVWEMRFDRSLLGDFDNLDFHITLACGNDWIDQQYNVIPEPATLLLFGFGLAGLGVTRRIRRSK